MTPQRKLNVVLDMQMERAKKVILLKMEAWMAINEFITWK